MKKEILRIIDANLNRSREGLRVCEEIARFIWQDKVLTEEFKALRHKISRHLKKLPVPPDFLLKCRNSQADIGRDILNKSGRKNYQDVFCANIQRVKESLRVLEEFSIIFSNVLSKRFARMRFRVYEIEKKTIEKIAAGFSLRNKGK